jgi:hypothetical protein
MVLFIFPNNPSSLFHLFKKNFFCFHIWETTYDTLLSVYYFAWYDDIQFHPIYYKWQNSILLYDWMILPCVYRLHYFIHSSADRLLGWFHMLSVENSAVINMYLFYMLT